MEYKGGRPFYGDLLGVIMLDMQAPLIPGNVGNAMSYDFPVRYKVLKGFPADWWSDEIGADESRCKMFIQAAKELEAEGCKAITSGCGFFAIYQKRVAAEVNIPVFLSPLVMVPMLSMMIGPNKKVGIITAGGRHLKGDFLKTVGIDENVNFAVGGLDDTEEFYKIHVTCEKDTINPKKVEEEVVQAAEDLLKKHPDIGCFVFECSDIPPFAREVVKRTGIPVFDFIGLAHMVARAIIPPKYPEFFA
ncbi:MAG: aspartate/glutamate racemase family protein [Tepidanaerobacteraceae bacterium]|jgi:Asp/Glu/hydantoin racemase|nr:aspartate/glutamate racemase family protein [Thermoanaerobacterales bacterium]